jgi:beta-fructofuranosidase
VQQQQQRGVGVVYFFSTMMTSSTDIVSIMQEGERAKLMMAENDAAAEEQQLSAVAPPSFNPNPSRPVSGPYVSVPSSDYPSRNFNGQKSESSVEVPLVVFGHTGDEEGEEDGPFSAKKKTAPGSSGSSSSSGYRQRSGWSTCSIGSASVILLIVLSLVVGIPIAIIARRASTEAQEHDASWVDPNATQHRTAFHFQPEQNWMNDPNGPMYYMGFYHLFYQYNPLGPTWGRIVWGHAVSTDLIHWQHLEVALDADHWYDEKGVWSGSGSFLEDGTPVLIYTGWSNTSTQTQNMALPADKTDPLLRQWVKVPQNPIAVAPPGFSSDKFRDPTTAWKGPDGEWRILVGSSEGEDNRDGTALLYKSKNFSTWQFSQPLHSVNGTGMWECPDFFPVRLSGKLGVEPSSLGPGVKHVLKISSEDKKHDYYVVGNYSIETDTFVPDSPQLDAGLGLRYDYGKLYASKTFFDQFTNRRINFGWINESDSEEADVSKGWASIMGIPRKIWLDVNAPTDLLQWPVEEVEKLRISNVSRENFTLGAGSVVPLEGVIGVQLDIEVSFELPDMGQAPTPTELLAESGQSVCKRTGAELNVLGPFGLLVLATADLLEQTAVYFQFVQSKEGWRTLFCSDQSQSSLDPYVDTTTYGTYVRVSEFDPLLSLRILVDHSVVESFAQGGRAVITSRVYPKHALDSSARIFLFNNGTQNITTHHINVWNMNGVKMTNFN